MGLRSGVGAPPALSRDGTEELRLERAGAWYHQPTLLDGCRSTVRRRSSLIYCRRREKGALRKDQCRNLERRTVEALDPVGGIRSEGE